MALVVASSAHHLPPPSTFSLPPPATTHRLYSLAWPSAASCPSSGHHRNRPPSLWSVAIGVLETQKLKLRHLNHHPGRSTPLPPLVRTPPADTRASGGARRPGGAGSHFTPSARTSCAEYIEIPPNHRADHLLPAQLYSVLLHLPSATSDLLSCYDLILVTQIPKPLIRNPASRFVSDHDKFPHSSLFLRSVTIIFFGLRLT